MAIDAIQKYICGLLPNQPPEKVRAWAEDRGAGDGNAIVYRSGWRENVITHKKEPCADCTCSACGSIFQIDKTDDDKQCCWGYGSGREFGIVCGNVKLYSGNYALCPICGAEVTVLHCTSISSEGRKLSEHTFVMFTVLPGGIPAAVSWLWQRCIFKNGKAKTCIYPLDAYAFVGRKAYRFSGWWRYMYRLCYGDFFDPCARCTDELGSIDLAQIYPFAADLFNGTVLENAKLDVYIKSSAKDKMYPITYLRTFQQHKQVENLIMQGCTRVFNDIVYACSYRSYSYATAKVPTQGINWKCKRPAEMLGITTEEFRACRKEKWSLDEMKLVQRAAERGIRFDVVQFRKEKLEYSFAKRALEFGLDPIRAIEYLDRQKGKGKELEEMNTRWLLDYWDTCVKLKLDLAPRIAFPQNLRREHDRVVALYNAAALDRKAKEYIDKEGRFKKLAEQYSCFSWESEGLCIRIAAAPRELLEEGAILGHCVGTYVNSHARGNQCIFFVRHANAPESPFYTLELDMDKLSVIQNRGKSNCARTPEVKAFEESWLRHISALAAQKTMKKGA